MSEAAPANAVIGHNKAPLVLPKDEEMLEEMRRKFPEIEKEIPDLEKSFATYAKPDGTPIELGLKDAEVANALTDLIDQAKKKRKAWKAYGAGEKGPLNKLVKVVTNFFTTADDKVGALLDKFEPPLQAYLDAVEDEKERQRQAEIARQQEKEAAARRAAEEEAARAETARLAAEEERRKEADARAAAEKAQRDREAAEASAAAARAEEKRLADEKRERDRAEKERNVAGLREGKAYMRAAERLHVLEEADEATDMESRQLDDLIRHGGMIGTTMAPVASSHILDDEQKAAVQEIKARLEELRTANNARFNKREQTKRAKAAAEAEARETALAEERRAAKEKADAELAAAQERTRQETEKANAAAEERRKADLAARTSREAARGHERDIKEATKGAAKAEDEADRAANRGDRLENRGPAKAQSRGDLGALGTKARTWKHYVDDEAAIRATMGPLGPHLGLEEIKSAAFWWMRAHQAGFEGERVLPPELPGIRFSLEEDLRTS